MYVYIMLSSTGKKFASLWLTQLVMNKKLENWWSNNKTILIQNVLLQNIVICLYLTDQSFAPAFGFGFAK